nr:hypothetical protein [Tanacetum cinerariifolium]
MHRHAAAPTKRGIQGFDDVGLAFAFGAGAGQPEAASRDHIARRLNTQAMTSRLARSTASQSQTLRRLRPTKVPISSYSSVSHRFYWAFPVAGAVVPDLPTALFLPAWPPLCAPPRSCARWPRCESTHLLFHVQTFPLEVRGRATRGRFHPQQLLAEGRGDLGAKKPPQIQRAGTRRLGARIALHVPSHDRGKGSSALGGLGNGRAAGTVV